MSRYQMIDRPQHKCRQQTWFLLILTLWACIVLCQTVAIQGSGSWGESMCGQLLRTPERSQDMKSSTRSSTLRAKTKISVISIRRELLHFWFRLWQIHAINWTIPAHPAAQPCFPMYRNSYRYQLSDLWPMEWNVCCIFDIFAYTLPGQLSFSPPTHHTPTWRMPHGCHWTSMSRRRWMRNRARSWRLLPRRESTFRRPLASTCEGC